jgi:iron complex transport system permease protein
VGGGLALKQSSALDALCLGDESARMIGISVQRERIKLILVISLLVGVSLSVGGALPFVGLIAPHFARLMIGPYVKTLIPASALFGASLTLAADLIARTARAPIDMDVGIITTIIGAPYFLWLLMRRSSL